MKDYIRDSKTGALFFNNREKESEILRERAVEEKMHLMENEINNLKRMVSELLALRN